MNGPLLIEPNGDELIELCQLSKIESIGAVAMGIAHDFNNLLTPVLLAMEEIQRSAHLSNRQSCRIEHALACVERARRLVQRLLNFAHMKPAACEAADIVEVLRAMNFTFASFLPPDVFIELELAADLPKVMVDRDQIETAILNLIVNSRDAMPEGGKIIISGAFEIMTQAEVGPSRMRPMMRLSVSDTGVGMTSETLKKAVDPFFSTKEIGKGTGLGLALVCATVKQFGGHFSIASKIGSGTTVDLWLPVAEFGHSDAQVS